MEDQDMQSAPDFEDVKERLIEDAAQELASIQITGQAVRSQIDVAKNQMLSAIKAENKQKQTSDALIAAKRSELIKKLGEAAKAGNLSEMQRIKNLLSEEGS